jgi:hypothetical protein
MTEVKQKPRNHAAIPDNPFKDDRINWLRMKVESTLELEFEQSKQPPSIVQPSSASAADIPALPEFFSDCLMRNDKENLQKLMDFLEDMDHGAAILFWAQKQVFTHEKVRQIEVPREEPAGLDQNNAPTSTDTVQNTSTEQVVQEVPTEIILETQTIVFETTILKMAFGIMPEDLIDTNAIFFLKNRPGPIPFPGSTSIVG